MRLLKIFFILLSVTFTSSAYADDVSCEKYLSYNPEKEGLVLRDITKSSNWSAENSKTLQAAEKDYTEMDLVMKGVTFCSLLQAVSKFTCNIEAKAVMGLKFNIDENNLPGNSYSVTAMLKRFLSEYEQEQMIDERKLSQTVSNEICSAYVGDLKHLKGI